MAAIEKYKKNTKVQGVFFRIFLYLFCIFLYFYKKNTKKIRKKYESKISKIQNTKKIQTQNLENTKYKKNTKKIRIQNLKNTKYKINTKKYEKNTKYKKIQTQHLQNAKFRKIQTQRRKKKANPMFTFGRKTQIAKKMQKQHVVFSTPCSSDFVFSSRIIFVFFLYF